MANITVTWGLFNFLVIVFCEDLRGSVETQHPLVSLAVSEDVNGRLHLHVVRSNATCKTTAHKYFKTATMVAVRDEICCDASMYQQDFAEFAYYRRSNVSHVCHHRPIINGIHPIPVRWNSTYFIPCTALVRTDTTASTITQHITASWSLINLGLDSWCLRCPQWPLSLSCTSITHDIIDGRPCPGPPPNNSGSVHVQSDGACIGVEQCWFSSNGTLTQERVTCPIAFKRSMVNRLHEANRMSHAVCYNNRRHCQSCADMTSFHNHIHATSAGTILGASLGLAVLVLVLIVVFCICRYKNLWADEPNDPYPTASRMEGSVSSTGGLFGVSSFGESSLVVSEELSSEATSQSQGHDAEEESEPDNDPSSAAVEEDATSEI